MKLDLHVYLYFLFFSSSVKHGRLLKVMLYLHNGSKKILEGVYIEAGSIGADNHKEKVRKAEGVLEISKNPQQAIKV